MRVAITGANGQVGHELVRRAGMGVVPVPFARTDLDIGDPAAVRSVLGAAAVDLVVNAAAYTAVDKAESEPDLAARVNAEGPRNLAAFCAERGIPLIHISTDYVFDGTGSGPYPEDAPVAPLGVYGRTKREGEEAIAGTLPEHVILRTSWVFGAHGANFVRTMMRLGAERPRLRVVADQTGGPTPAAAIADAIWTIAGRLPADGRAWGVHHFSGAPATTWHGLAVATLAAVEGLGGPKAVPVDAIATSDYPTPARRPANSALDCGRISRTFGIAQPDWRAGLLDVVREIMEQTR